MDKINPKNYVNERKEFATKYSTNIPSNKELFATLEKERHGTLDIKEYLIEITEPLYSSDKTLTLEQKEAVLTFAFNRIHRRSYDAYAQSININTIVSTEKYPPHPTSVNR